MALMEWKERLRRGREELKLCSSVCSFIHLSGAQYTGAVGGTPVVPTV